MEYLRSRTSRFVVRATASAESRSVNIIFKKRFDKLGKQSEDPNKSIHPDQLHCTFYLVEDDKYLELGHGIETWSNDQKSVTITAPIAPGGSQVFFNVHATFFGGFYPFSAHGHFIVPQMRMPRIYIPHSGHGAAPPQEQRATPLVYPTGDMKDKPEFLTLQKQVIAEYQKAHAELSQMQIIKKYNQEILRRTTISFRNKHSDLATACDEQEKQKTYETQEQDPVLKSFRAEHQKRIAEHEILLASIKDPNEKKRIDVISRPRITAQLHDELVANWEHKARTYVAKNVGYTKHLEDALGRLDAHRGAQKTDVNIGGGEKQRRLRFRGAVTNVRNAFRNPARQNGPNINDFVGDEPYNDESQNIGNVGEQLPKRTPQSSSQQEYPDDSETNQGNNNQSLPNQPTQNSPQTNTPKYHPNTRAEDEEQKKSKLRRGLRDFRLYKMARFFGTSFWPLIIAMLFLIIFTAAVDLTGNNDTTHANPDNTITISKTSTDPVDKKDSSMYHVDNTKPLHYTLTANSSDGAGVEISDPIPTNTTFDSASGNPKLEDGTGNEIKDSNNNKDKVATVVWNLSTDEANSGVNLTLLPKEKDSYVINQANARTLETNKANSGNNSLQKSVDKKQANKGDIVTYSLKAHYENMSGDITIDDKLPNGMQIVSASTKNGNDQVTSSQNGVTINTSSNEVKWNFAAPQNTNTTNKPYKHEFKVTWYCPTEIWNNIEGGKTTADGSTILDHTFHDSSGNTVPWTKSVLGYRVNKVLGKDSNKQGYGAIAVANPLSTSGVNTSLVPRWWLGEAKNAWSIEFDGYNGDIPADVRDSFRINQAQQNDRTDLLVPVDSSNISGHCSSPAFKHKKPSLDTSAVGYSNRVEGTVYPPGTTAETIDTTLTIKAKVVTDQKACLSNSATLDDGQNQLASNDVEVGTSGKDCNFNEGKDNAVPQYVQVKAPKSGAWFYVSVDKQHLYAFEDGKPVQTYEVSTGQNNKTPLTTGILQLFDRGKQKNPSDPGWSVQGLLPNEYVDNFWTLFPDSSPNSNILIHPLPFQIGNAGVHNYLGESSLGKQPSSEGCIRMWSSEFPGHANFDDFTNWAKKFKRISFTIDK